MKGRLSTVLLTVVLMMLVGSSAAFAWSPATPDDISEALKKDLVHPYLYFSEDDKPSILDRIENDPYTRDVMDRISSESNRLLYTPVEVPLPPQPMDSRFVARDPYLPIFDSYRAATLKLAFMYQMTGDERYAEKSFEFAEALCDLNTWVIRACQYPKSYFRVSPWGVTDDKVVFTFAIFAAHTAAELSTVYDWLYPWMDKVKRDRIRGALLEKAILPVRGNYEYHWWSTAYRCNWLATCFSGLGMSALTLLKEDPHLVDVVAESVNRINRLYDEIGEDGGWQEGAGYVFANQFWAVTYGIPLKRATEGKYSLLDHPKMRTFPVTFNLAMFLPPDKSVNFCDSGYGAKGRPPFVFHVLADEFKSAETSWYVDNLAGEPRDVFDVIFPRTTVTPSLPEKASRHFRSIDWTVMRSDFTGTDNVVIACKSGKNDDPHHGHLDIGHFLLYWRGQSFIRDLGNSGYDEKAFDATRWDMPKAASRGHNVVFVNGEEQIPGKRFDEALDESIGGEVLEFRTGENLDYTLMDSSNAYPRKELKRWRRHVVLLKPDVTLVLDEIEAQRDNSEVSVRFHSECPQRIMDGLTMLDGADGYMALIPVSAGAVSIEPGRHAQLQIKENARFEWLDYVDTIVRPPSRKTVVAHVIIPVDGEDDASAVAGSVTMSDTTGGMTVSLVKDGETHTFSFVKGKDGLVLAKETVTER